MRVRWLLALGLLPLLSAGALADGETKVQGVIEKNTVWRGTVRLTGDVTVAQGVRLDIARGTHVIISSKADPRGGWNDQLVEMHVHGLVIADGVLSSPVTFEPQVWIAKRPEGRPDVENQPWLGILFHPDAERGSELRGCVFHGGVAAVQVGAPGVHIRDCVFHRCSTGIGAGVLWASTVRLGLELLTSTPRIERCRFTDCYIGVTVERSGRPEIERCLFLSCVVGVGNRREGITWFMRGLGPFVDRSLFAHCDVGLNGASRLTNSIFVENEIALLASMNQHEYSCATDRVVRSCNLYFGNETITVGDTPIGEPALLSDPLLLRPLPKGMSPLALSGNLRRLCELRPLSPALGAATDGGDLGPAGEVGTVRPWAIASDPGEALVFDRWLVAGPPSAEGASLDPKLVGKLLKRPPKAGRAFGDQSWAVLDDSSGAQGAPSPVLAEGPPMHRVAAAFCTARTATRGVLLIGLDGVVEGWWNGERLGLPPGRRRFDPDDARVRVRVRKGRNVLLLEINPVGEEHRFLCRLVSRSVTRPALAGVAVDDGAYASASTSVGGRVLEVESAMARRERGTSTYTLGLRLSARVHWADASVPARMLALTSGRGRPVSLKGLEAEYKPGTRFLRLRGLALRPGVPYTVRLLGARAPDGSTMQTADAPVDVEMR